MRHSLRYSRAYGSYQDFLDRVLLLTRKLLNQGFLLAKMESTLRKFYGGRYGLCVTNDYGYVPLVVSTLRSFPHSWLITGFVTRLTRRWNPSSPLVFREVRVNRSLVVCICFVDRCLSFCSFSFDHCVVRPSLNYGIWDYLFGIFKFFLNIHDSSYNTKYKTKKQINKTKRKIKQNKTNKNQKQKIKHKKPNKNKQK